MEVGLILGTGDAQYSIDLEMIKAAEAMGFHSVWTSEAWGADAISSAAWILGNTTKIKVGTGICQMQARTPALMATTSITLQELSGGRFILGLGPSGPQVIEGWHGRPYGKPLELTQEYVSIIRKVIAREQPLTHEGEHYQIPYQGPGATGLGKPLKTILRPRHGLKIYSASVSPGGIRNAAEVCDGVIPVYMDPSNYDAIGTYINQGFDKAGGGKSLETFDVCPFVTVVQNDDIEQARKPVKENMGFYIGGMGAKKKNYYKEYASRLGYAEQAEGIQDAFLSGRRAEAFSMVPDELVDKVALVGPQGHIREQLSVWKEAGKKRQVSAMLCRVSSKEAMETLAKELL
ncbi:MAG: LLM class F420-dependent oxidoreductase [Rhizobiales bacterium NRL2]|jgi:F420-dependent oxidoreductase-like protein|nr:MAG: LLM class F420-dependent oxidoreductase [Rhizobiales bacterium NRL2]